MVMILRQAIAEREGHEMIRVVRLGIHEKPILPYPDITEGPAISASARSGCVPGTNRQIASNEAKTRRLIGNAWTTAPAPNARASARAYIPAPADR